MPNQKRELEWSDLVPVLGNEEIPENREDRKAVAAAAQQPKPAVTVFDYLREMFGNVPASAAQTAGSYIDMLTSPIQTAKGLAGVVGGAAGKLLPEQLSAQTGLQQFEPQAEAFGQAMGQRYGSPLETLKTDPVGMLSDAASVATMGGGALSRVPAIGRYARMVQRAGQAADPLTLAGKGVGKGAKLAGETGKYLEGITTSGGKRLFDTAADFPELTWKGISGKLDEYRVLNDFKDALDQLRSERMMKYRQALSQLPDQPLSMQPVYDALKEKLRAFNVKVQVRHDAQGNVTGYKLNFDKSRLATNPADQARVQELFDIVRTWESKGAGSRTMGLDTLKGALDNLYSDTSDVRAMVADLRSKTRQQLSRVPGYDEMVGDYEKATKMIEATEQELSLGRKANPGITLRKLFQTFSQASEYRQSIVEALDRATNRNLTAEIAGIYLNKWTPTGWARPIAGIGMVTAGALSEALNPYSLLMLMSTSPKITGAATVGVAKAVKTGKKASKSTAGRIARRTLAPTTLRPGAHIEEQEEEE